MCFKKLKVMKNISVLIIIAIMSSLFNFSSDAQAKKDVFLQLYSVRDDIKADYAGTIAKLAKIGYTGVEAAGYKDGKFYGMSPADFAKSIQDVGMRLISSHLKCPLPENIKDTNWDEVWTWWDTAIKAHKDAGIDILILPWIRTPKTAYELKTYADYLNKLGEKCNAAGVSFGYHNHSFEFKKVNGETIYDYMLKNTDPKKVFFQMDVYWVKKGGCNPVEYFKKYPGRFKLLHIKDETELGKSGKIDFKAIYDNLDKAGTKYPVVEIEWYTKTPLESAKECCDYLLNADFVKSSYE